MYERIQLISAGILRILRLTAREPYGGTQSAAQVGANKPSRHDYRPVHAAEWIDERGSFAGRDAVGWRCADVEPQAAGEILLPERPIADVTGTAVRGMTLGLAISVTVNALFFHLATERRIAEWNEGAGIPIAAKLAGLISLAAWATVIMAGRMMSYTMF